MANQAATVSAVDRSPASKHPGINPPLADEAPSDGLAPAQSSSYRPIDEIDAAIVTLARRINANCYEMLVLIREFDDRRGWARWASVNCADWLHWRCDLSHSAAREHVRVAQALRNLPRIAAAFQVGDLSYSKVRPLTRVADAQNEESLLAMAEVMTAAQVEQYCRQRRYAKPESRKDAVHAHELRSLRCWRDERRGIQTIVLELPIADGMLFERGIDKASVDQGRAHDAPDDSTPWAAIQADAAVAMARAYLDGFGDESADPKSTGSATRTASATSSTADHYQVMIHVDHDALAGREGQSELPIDTVKRLCCDGSLVPIIENDEGVPLNVGRRRRVVSTSIRRALWARDRGCVFPGCSHTRFVDAHHIRHWAEGGETSLKNLVLLCSAHHQTLHEGGYDIRHDHLGKRYFRRPDGRVMPACGYRVNDWQDDYSDNARSENDSAEGFAYPAPDDSADSFHAREPEPVGSWADRVNGANPDESRQSPIVLRWRSDFAADRHHRIKQVQRVRAGYSRN